MKHQNIFLFVSSIVAILIGTPSCTHSAEPLQPGDSERKIMVNGAERTYILHVPPGLDSVQSVPVVFAFHEHFEDAPSMQRLTGFNDISNKAGFLLVYPEGIGNSWNAGRCCGAAATKDLDEAAFVRQILADLGTNVNIDTRRIFAAGLGNGGALVYRFACEMSDTFPAVASVGGSLLSSPCQPSQPVSITEVHGLKDDPAPYEGGGDFNNPPVEELIHTWAQLDGCTDSPQVDKENIITHTRYASCKAGTAVELYALEEGEHVWPSKEVLDTSQIIWDFFAAHPKQ
jgi:polyhydroxybutyrate depolymerase